MGLGLGSGIRSGGDGHGHGSRANFYFKAASAINVFAQAELLQAGQGRFDHVGRVVGPERFAQNIFDADRFQHGAHGFAGDDAGAGRGGTQQDFGAAVAAKNFVRDGRILQGDADHVLLGHFAALADGFGNFDGFAQANADMALFVTGDDQRAKAEAASAFDDFGGAIDENNFLAQLGAAGLFERAVGAAFG